MLTLCVICAVAGSPVVTEEALDGMLHLPEVVHRHIQLSTDAAENQMLRSEFYYEQVWTWTFSIVGGGFQLTCLVHSVSSDKITVNVVLLAYKTAEVERAFV